MQLERSRKCPDDPEVSQSCREARPGMLKFDGLDLPIEWTRRIDLNLNPLITYRSLPFQNSFLSASPKPKLFVERRQPFAFQRCLNNPKGGTQKRLRRRPGDSEFSPYILGPQKLPITP